jgi:hypothetical protein
MGQEAGGESARYVVEVGLIDGQTLRGQPSEVRDLSARLAHVDQRLSADTFTAVDDQLVVRSEEVRYVRIVEADSSSPRLLDTIKDKIGGSQMSSGYGQEPGQTSGYGPGGGYDASTQPAGSHAVRAQSGGRQGEGRGWMDDMGYGRRPWVETKPFFLTSEFLAFVFATIGVGVAMATSDLLDAHRGWTLMAAIAIGYMVSRGLAKSGARDPNPERRYRD